MSIRPGFLRPIEEQPAFVGGMSTTISETPGPAWASWLGIVAVIFGILLTGVHGNEWLTQQVITPGSAAAQGIPPSCPQDELIEERISVVECELLVAKVNMVIASRPDWFRGFQMGLASLGTVVAFCSIFVGVVLVQYRDWAPRAAVITFAALLSIDAIGFIAATNTGPLLRAAYLWDIVVWFFIHLVMTVGAIAGSTAESAP